MTAAKLTRTADRYLVALYRVGKGRPNAVVSRAAVEAEVAREALLDLTDEQFERYRQRAIAEARALRETPQA